MLVVIVCRYLGRLETEWTPEVDLLHVTGAPILLGGANSSNYVPADPATVALLNEYEGPVLAANKQVVGELACLGQATGESQSTLVNQG